MSGAGPGFALAFPGSAKVPGVLCLVGRVGRSPPQCHGRPAAPDSAQGCPTAGRGGSLRVADADKPLLPQPGVCKGEDTGAIGCLVALIWYARSTHLGAAAGGGEGSDFQADREPCGAWEGAGFSRGSAPNRAWAVFQFSMRVFQFQVSRCAHCNIRQRLARPPALLSEEQQGRILSCIRRDASRPTARPAAGAGMQRAPCPAPPSSLCSPEPAFTPGTSSLGECNVGMSRCSDLCARSCPRMLRVG